MYEILKEENRYSLFKADNGNDVLDIIDKEDVNILILDVVMPGMDGFEVCKQVRQKYSMRPIQIVLISGHDRSNTLEELLELGADDFVGKPISPLELDARVKAACIRWKNQKKLIDATQRDSYLYKKHGDFSSLIAENLQLRQEYDRVRKANEKLEKNNQELQMLASLDTLSGLLNRRTLFKRIDVEIERSLRLGLPLTGIMIDIDHFKRVNDNYGHPCGDMIIRDIGKKLTHNLRKYDYAGRYGGEEFFSIFPNTDSSIAFKISERFRKEMEETNYNCEVESFNVTVSIGIAQFKLSETPEKWIKRADNAMYSAKQQGRNRVVFK